MCFDLAIRVARFRCLPDDSGPFLNPLLAVCLQNDTPLFRLFPVDSDRVFLMRFPRSWFAGPACVFRGDFFVAS
jgi:hypothetical protein